MKNILTLLVLSGFIQSSYISACENSVLGGGS